MKKVAKTILIAMFSGSIGLSNVAMAQVPVLIKDLQPGSNHGDPRSFTESNNILFFTATDGQHGTELYRTDGTEAGTVLVKDILSTWPSSSPQPLTDVNGVLFFSAEDGIHGRELWKSDGTEEGTVLVKDINPSGGGVSMSHFLNVDGTLFFIADDGITGYELWKSDGTESGTILVKDIRPSLSGVFPGSNPVQFTALNGTLFFTADNGVDGEELWKSDGTEAGTVMVKDINPSGNGVYSVSADYTPFCVLNNILYFIGNDGTNGFELWKSDGTESGTTMVKDIIPGHDSSMSLAVAVPFVFNNFIYFSATDGTQTGLWKSDGTSTGTEFIFPCVNPGRGTGYLDSEKGFACNANTLFFCATGVAGSELYKTDGTTAGTMMIKDINPGADSSLPGALTMVGNTLYFRAGVEVEFPDLWKSDGTEAGTLNVSSGYCDQPNYLTAYHGALIFTGNNDTVGEELWRVGEPTLGIDQTENPISVNLFPNPGNGKFTCISSEIFSEIRIYNVSGKTVYTEKIHSQKAEIDLTGQPKGIYFYQLMDGYQRVKAGKIILE